MRTLVYKVVEDVNCFLDPLHPSIKMFVTGSVYRIERKFLWIKLKPIYDYELDIPYIENPFYNGQYNTNRTLKWLGSRVTIQLKEKIEEFKQNDYGNK